MKKYGFSLLELSIVLTILAIVVAGGLTLGTAKVQQQEIIGTYQELEDIQKTLKVFLAENGRLPCPASITLARNSALFGREATDCADATPPAGLVRVEYPAASGEYVRIGAVPFYSLEMPDRYLDDAWQGRYLYAVEEAAITALTSSDTGNIQVVDDAGASITDEAVVVLISAGKSHRGAYSAKMGTLFSACDATNKDKENCDADGIFTDAVYNDGSTAANFFDDIVLWNTRMTLFETVSTTSSGGWKPWDTGYGKPPADYPLEIKGVTANLAANLGYAMYTSRCDMAYPDSWMLRASDLRYIENIPAIAGQSRFHIDECNFDTGPSATPLLCWIHPNIRFGLHTALNNANATTTLVNGGLSALNCNNWGAAGGTDISMTLMWPASAGSSFRERPIMQGDNTSHTAQGMHEPPATGLGFYAADCSTAMPVICVGEK